MTTYMALDRQGVQEFKEQRKFRRGNWTLWTFHCGSTTENPGVQDWLTKLANIPSGTSTMLVELIRRMISMKEGERPNAKDVTARLRLIALSKVVEPTDELFSKLSKRDDSFDILLEQRRFEGWKYAFGVLDLGSGLLLPNHYGSEQVPNFEPVLDVLFKIRINTIARRGPKNLRRSTIKSSQ